MPEAPNVKPKDIAPPKTPEETAMLHYFRGSFRISQGNALAQNPINDWAMSRGLIPSVDMSSKVPDYLKIRPPRLHIASTEVRIRDDRSDAWDDLRLVVEHGPRSTPEQARTTILREVLMKEIVYQMLTRRGRDFTDDMFDSHLRRNIVLGEKVASPVLNQLLAELREDLTAIREEPTDPITDEMVASKDMKEIEELLRSVKATARDLGEKRIKEMGVRRNLAILEKLWEDHHPGEKFFPATQAA